MYISRRMKQNRYEACNELYGNGNSTNAEFWQYDARLGRRWNLDLVPQVSISDYACFGNNPLLNIDKKGAKFLNFDKDGNYIGVTKNNWFHNFFIGTKGKYWSSDKESRTFKFADPINDGELIIQGKIKHILFVEEKDIKIMLYMSGAFDEKNKIKNNSLKNRYSYILKEGKGGGLFDFSFTHIPAIYGNKVSDQPNDSNKPTPYLFLVNGYAHNHMNFGNFLYGAAGEALGLDLSELCLGAHYNSLTEPKNNGYERQFDSRDDQLSIKLGYRHGLRNRYHKITTKTPSIEVGKITHEIIRENTIKSTR